MPEGDTIHAAARRLQIALEGRVLAGFLAPRLAVAGPPPGVRVGAARARGKHLLLPFEDGSVLHTHLGMHGSWRVLPGTRLPSDRRVRAAVATDEASAVCVRAAVCELLDDAALRRHPRLRALGPDLTVPEVDLDVCVQRLGQLVTRGTSIGDALLDQRPASGIGNVIMMETCFLRGTRPTRPVELVDVELRHALYGTAASLLQHNVSTHRRTTVDGGRPGALHVYERGGRPCRRCGTTIEAARTGRNARWTWWCPRCQPA